MSSSIPEENITHLKEVEDVLSEEQKCNGRNKDRPILRETASRLNRHLPASVTLQRLPELSEAERDEQFLLHGANYVSKEGAVDCTPSDTSRVQFGFNTPSKKRRQSMLQFALTASTQKRQLQELALGSPAKALSEDAEESNKEKTPKRKKASPSKTPTGSCKDDNAQSPRTPGRNTRSKGRALLTPKCVPMQYKDGSCTPRSRRSLAPALLLQKETPVRVRRSIRKRMLEVAYNTDYEEESDNSESSVCESESDVEEECRNNKQNLSTKSLTKQLAASEHNDHSATAARRSRRKRPCVEDDEDVNSIEYFLRNDGNKGAICTSDHTLGKLGVPRLSSDAVRALVQSKQVCTDHRIERSALFDDHCALFDKWTILLQLNYSVFIYGVGSKKALLSEFQSRCLSDHDLIVVNGFFPSLTMKNVLSSILEEILGMEGFPASPTEQLQLLLKHYSTASDSLLYLIIHNLDGPMLRSASTQRTLSQLCSLDTVRLVASMDHLNAPLILDSRSAAEYNPIWFDCTTFANYAEETSYENSLIVQQSSNLAITSLLQVFKSLTPGAKAIFLLLAQYQLEHQNDNNYLGLSFPELHHRCRDRMLANSELTLRAQLTEFIDHKLVKLRRDLCTGVEVLTIPMEATALGEFVEQHLQEEEQ